jgi:hypothetical protein
VKRRRKERGNNKDNEEHTKLIMQDFDALSIILGISQSLENYRFHLQGLRKSSRSRGEELQKVAVLSKEEWRLLGCYAVWRLYERTFRRNVSPPSSWLQESMR